MRRPIRNRFLASLLAYIAMLGLYILGIQPVYRHTVISNGALGGLLVALFFLYTVGKSYKNERYGNELETMLGDECLETIQYQAAGKSFVNLSTFPFIGVILIVIKQSAIAIRQIFTENDRFAIVSLCYNNTKRRYLWTGSTIYKRF